MVSPVCVFGAVRTQHPTNYFIENATSGAFL
jgi:hypothetical protein